MRLGEMREAGAARHGRGDGNKLLVALRKFRERLADDLGIGRRRRRRRLAALDLVFAEAVKFVRLFNGRLIAPAFFGKNVEQNRLILRFQKLKCPNQQRDIVPIDWTVVPQPQFFENNTRHD